MIKLKIFTGNTITNSYTESVNAQLCRFGVVEKGTCLFQLTLLQHFVASKPHTKLSTFNPEPLNGMFEDEVFVRITNGVLSLMVEKLKLAKETCKIVEETDEHFKVEQLITCAKNDWIFQKLVHWTVYWNLTTITCSCNGLTYGGVPCLHLLVIAWKKSKKIPLFCFNQRFFFQQTHDDTEANTTDQPSTTIATEPFTSETNATPETHGTTCVVAVSDSTTEASTIAGIGAPVEPDNIIEHIDGTHTTTEHAPSTEADHMTNNESEGANAHTSVKTTVCQPSSVVEVSTTPDEIHSNDMWLSSQFTSHQACYVRGATQVIAMLYLRALTHGVPLEHIISHVQSTLQQVGAQVKEWDTQFAPRTVVMPHPLLGGAALPPKSVPQSIARECGQILQQIVSSVPHPPGLVPDESEESGEPVRQRPRTA